MLDRPLYFIFLQDRRTRTMVHQYRYRDKLLREVDGDQLQGTAHASATTPLANQSRSLLGPVSIIRSGLRASNAYVRYGNRGAAHDSMCSLVRRARLSISLPLHTVRICVPYFVLGWWMMEQSSQCSTDRPRNSRMRDIYFSYFVLSKRMAMDSHSLDKHVRLSQIFNTQLGMV